MLVAHEPPLGDSLRARQLWLAGEARTAMLDMDSALTLWRQARRADPHFLPAQLALMNGLVDRESFAGRERSALEDVTDPALAACLHAVVLPRNVPVTVKMLHDVERRFGPAPCTRALIAEYEIRLPTSVRPPMRPLAEWRAMIGSYGMSGEPWLLRVNVLCDDGALAAADSVLDQAEQSVATWRDRLRVRVARADVSALRGDTARAQAIREQVWAAVLRDGRPGPLVELLISRIDRIPDARLRDSLSARGAMVARRYHARASLVAILQSEGTVALDRGDLSSAIPALREAVSVSDSTSWRPLRARLHAKYGRALLKQGRAREGITQLEQASAIADTADRYGCADIQHNLAHAYESLGDLPMALAAVNRFVALAAPLRLDGLAVIANYDAGLMQWEAGLHASSRNSFEQMVRIVDEMKSYFYYAGDYYERIGDLPRARSYYTRVPERDSEEGARALAGLTRTFEALGMIDSAESTARRHDAAPATPEEIPLLPEVLARRGRFDEARSAMAAWVTRRSSEGGVQRATRAGVQLARILFDAGSADRAIVEARRAGQLARSSHLVEDATRAAGIEGRALLQMHRANDAVLVLSDAATSLGANPPPELRVDVFDALGRALAAAGRNDEALGAYDQAAAGTDRIASRFGDDVDRVRLRAEKLAPFDDAVRLLAVRNGPRDSDALLRWVQRRQDALYADPAHGTEPISLRVLRARLGKAAAFIDYVTLDTLAFALVVTRAGAAVVRLPETTAAIAAAVRALRRPMGAYLGRIDLSRLRFDRRASAQLYRMLITPLAGRVAGASRLVIVPDGPLHLLPFDALLPSDAPAAPFLIDRYEISYLPSPRFFGTATGAPSFSGGSLLFVGYDAVNDSTEWRNVSHAWTGRTMKLLGIAATKDAFKRSAARATIIHFAAHARASTTDPLAAYLRLAPGTDDDGLLHASEIGRMRIGASLVVLSACETDEGVVLRGAGPLGIARGFLLSGARAVVGTEWPVGETVAALMPRFYRRLSEGESPSAALRAAKQSLAHDPKTSNPFYWASFTLTERL
ncbi:MAG TPA: CHAT domain-containing protein [Gemmatimonadaceae bacterium]|nr:CHAT domain-containing protein [Gemmatimonadaceae bacterium]